MKINQGFTMIEILIAVAVVGVLAFIALPAYRSYVAAGEVDSCINYITPARMVADNIIQLNSGSAVGVTAASVGLVGTSNNCDAITVSGDALGNTSISGTVNTSVGNSTLSWSRTPANGIWVCTSSNASMGTRTCP